MLRQQALPAGRCSPPPSPEEMERFGAAASSERRAKAGKGAVPAAGLFLAPLLLWKGCCFAGVCSEAAARAQRRRWGKESELIQLGETIEEEGSKAKRHMKNLKSRRQQYFQGFMWH